MSYVDFIEGVLHAVSSQVVMASRQRLATAWGSNSTQIVTAADRAVGGEIVRQVRETYPDHRIIEEETGVTGGSSPYTWVIDPIDGTSNFAAGSPHYGVMIGLLLGGQAVAAGVAMPSFGETYLAERGSGAFVNGIPLRVEPATELATSLVAYGIDAVDPDTARADFALAHSISLVCGGLRMSNSVFDLMMVARGVYGAFLHRNTRIWDIVAPGLIVEEAGHSYTDLSGAPISFTPPIQRWKDTFAVCAAAHSVQESLHQIIREWSSCRKR